ncbi:MAG TPA: Hsp70 family protein, partial [Pseudomonadales bacterium]|nr:Hsp70 family protein [Pseudomonadales bacterium]
MTSTPARYIVGIDLGTTNTVVAYVDMTDAPDSIRLFEIEQFVAPGELKALPMLPSLRYHPAPGELPEDLLNVPGHTRESNDTGQAVFGYFARQHSSKVEGRAVISAKSWLSHPSVDRTAAILPWGADDGVPKVSPVVASASYLVYVRDAWNKQHPEHPLAQQEVVLTVPASFDESARALTLKAAKQAGLQQLRLLEEPQAVCYDWLHRHAQQIAGKLSSSKLLLVCDVGGGTTDLTLIKIRHSADGVPELTRIGVGDHLMLGGDNIDLALAHRAEQQLQQDNKKLSTTAFSQLVQQCCLAKERLLAEDGPEKTSVTLLGSGTRLMGGALSLELKADEVRQLVLDGFLPQVNISDAPRTKRSALVEFGLPYAADAAITRHIAAFLLRHQRVCVEALGLAEHELAIPDTLLLNGGFFNSAVVVQALIAQLQEWRAGPVNLLDNPHPDLAVAYGAVASGLAQRGLQSKIGGGSARSYFLLIDKANAQALCLLPRASEENQFFSLDQSFLLTLDAPVQFELASTTRDDIYLPGQLLTLDEDFPVLPPLMTVMKKRGSL